MRILLLVSVVACTYFTFEQIPSFGYATKQSRFSTLIYANNSLYTFGGADINDYSNDLSCFSLTNLTWTLVDVNTDDIPSPRVNSFGFMYNDEIYIYGGKSKNALKNDLWSFNIAFNAWKKIECSGVLPKARIKPSVLFNESSLFVYGGDTSSGVDSRIFELDLKSFEWKAFVNQGKIESRAGSALFWYNETLNIWGGSTYSTNLTQIDLTTLEITDIFVSSMVAQTMVFFPFAVYNDALYIFQGYTYPYADYNLNCSVLNLTSLTLENFECPFDSLFNSYAQLDNKLYLFGSELYNNFTNELIQIDLADNLNLTILSPHNDYPPSRVDHTMFRCRNFLWVFGGRSNGKYYDDSWKFDVVSEKWELIDPSTNSPSARYGHKGIYLHGDAYIIFGGFDGFSYFNDIFLYNFVANSWSDISGSRDIPARIKPCLFIKYPDLYIHGGLSSTGVLSDLWKFNFASSLYEEIITVGSAPALFNHICINNFKELNITVVFSGTSATGQSNPYIYTFNRYALVWLRTKTDSSLSLSNTRYEQLSNDAVLIIGGSHYYQAMNEVLLYNFNNVTLLFYLPRALVSYEIAHVGKFLYIFGGSHTIDKSFFPDKGTQNLYKLLLSKMSCSPGYYADTCEICPMGSYSTELNSKTCELCEPGTYSDGLGLTSKSQCLPCPYGTFNDKYGKHQCYFCGNSDECWFNTVNKNLRDFTETFVSTQPKPYDKRESEVKYCIEITQICVIVSLCIVCVFFIFDRKLKVYYMFDIYKEQHPSEDGKIAKKTAFGGLCSLIFLILSIFFILSPVFYYTISNVSETKTLVPGFTLENKDYRADYIFVSIKLYNMNYCVDSITGECSNIITLASNGISISEKKKYFCKKINDYCQISSLIEGVTFDQIGYLNATIQSEAVFTTGIEIYIRISTSMPKDYNESSIKYFIEPPKNFVFNGIEPSSFYIGLIPTVFFCDESIGCKSNKTGYHITNLKNPESGSLSNSLNINSYNSFSLSIYFEKSQNSFVIEWRLNTSLFSLISGILGSLAGLFGAVGWVMVFNENKKELINARIKKHKKLKKLKKKRKEFKAGLTNLDDTIETVPTERKNDPESKELALV